MKKTHIYLFLLTLASAVLAEYNAEELKAKVETNQKRAITDEDFFGVYEDGKWTNEPMIDYSCKPKLRAVEYFVKKGDYQRAGEELLKYFRGKDYKVKDLQRSWNAERVELWKDNIFGFDQQERVVDILEVSDKRGSYEVDVTGHIREGANTYMLMGRTKNDSMIYAASKEAEKGASELALLVGDKWKYIPASADVYIRAGSYSKENYGDAKILEICNSGTGSQKPFDSGTRRTLISFDTSKVQISDVKKAKLKITVWSERQADKLIVWHSYPTVVKEKTDTWANSLGYQYSWQGIEGGVEWGRPAGAHGQYPNWTRRMYWLPQMTAAGINGNDPKIVKKTISLLRDFIADYSQNPRNELNVTARAIYLCDCLPYLFESPQMSVRDSVEIIKFLRREGEYLYLNPSKLRRDNMDNMGMSLVSAMITLSANFPELIDSRVWLADGRRRCKELVQHLVMSDGAYIEHTMGYPFSVLNSMLDLIELCDKHNVELPDIFPEKTQQLAVYLMNVSMPDGVPPAWGEGNPRDTRTNPTIKRAAEFFDDKDLKWWCGIEEDLPAPDYTSVHYPEAKVIVSRSGWDTDSLAMFFAPRSGGAHLHVDQNQIVLSAYGSKLLVDTGMSSYSSTHPHFDWQRHQTKSHNTVEVDGAGYPRTGNRTNNGLGAPEPDCGSKIYLGGNVEYMKGYAAGYPNVTQYRSILFIKQQGLYIVSDMMAPSDNKEHTYDQCWHLHPSIDFLTDKNKMRVFNSRSNKSNIEISCLYPENAEMLIREGFNANPLGDTKYPSFRQQKRGTASFYTVLLPSRAGERPEVESNVKEASENVFACKLKFAEGEGIYVHNTSGGEISAAGVETDAELAYIQFGEKGEVKQAFIFGGNKLILNGKKVKFKDLSEGKI